jgi:predicted ferric reductase
MGERLKRWNERAISLREKFSARMVVRMLVMFLVSLILYYATDNYFLEAFFGFLMIVFGSVVLLFVIVYLIFIFLGRMLKYSDKKTIRKASKKKLVEKKVVRKKTVKKKSTLKKKPVEKVVRKK